LHVYSKTLIPDPIVKSVKSFPFCLKFIITYLSLIVKV